MSQKMVPWKHGYYTKEAIEERRIFRDRLKKFKKNIEGGVGA